MEEEMKGQIALFEAIPESMLRELEEKLEVRVEERIREVLEQRFDALQCAQSKSLSVMLKAVEDGFAQIENRAKPTESTKETIFRFGREFLGGIDPLDQKTRIITRSGEPIENVYSLDHFFSKSVATIETMWAISMENNLKLRVPSFYLEHVDDFRNYQKWLGMWLREMNPVLF